MPALFMGADMYAPGYQAGKWKVNCDRCGFNFRNTDLRLEWTGLRVCTHCFEERHPQDMLRGVADRQAPPWARPEGPPRQPFKNDGGTDITPADL
jgi:hypothetical protein